MLNKVQLYYFSPTGGTKACADIFCKGLSQNVSNVNLGLREPVSEADGELMVFALPCYGGRVPAVAAEKIGTLKGCGKKAVTMVVYGTRAYDDALLELNNIATAADFQIVASAAVVAQHSMVTAVGKGRPDQEDTESITAFSGKVLEKLESGIESRISVPGNYPYKDALNLPVTPICLPACGLCGQCVSACPSAAMSIEDGEVKTNADSCILCLACVSVCPKNARVVPAPLQETMNGKLAEFVSVRRENEFFL